MPPRWLLPKTRVPREESRGCVTQPGKTETTQIPKWDDFCFADEAAPPPIKNPHEGDRPNTSSGITERDMPKSPTRPYVGLTVPRPRTSEGRPPSMNHAGYSPSKLEEGMIGVAFGSPTHPPATFFGTLNDLAPPSTYEDSVFEQAEPMYQIKGRTSKWQKLGSLFKGGKAAASKDDMFEIPFYKVRIEDDSPEPEMEPRRWKEAEPAVEFPARRSPTPPPKDNIRRSIDERLAKARLEVARLEEAIATTEKKTIEKEKASADPSRPKLDLVIPDIRMDRYSVMFAQLQEIPPHSTLLARRSRKLGRLKPISTEDVKQIDEAVTPNTDTLCPRLPQTRRATSPSATKTTAGFSLFPAATLTPNYMTRQIMATPSPRLHLKRSVTSPARLSPRAETSDSDKNRTQHPPRTDSSRAYISPGNTTASTEQDAPWSAEAFLSPTSTITTIDEDIFLTSARDKEANVPEQKFLAVNEAQHMQFLASPTLPRDTGETPEATTPVLSVDPSQEEDYKMRRVASSVFDAAIAEIEAFGVLSLQEQPPLPSPPSAYVPFVLAPDENERKPSTTTTLRPPPAVSKSRFMMMNMPSPITEAPEESPVPSPAKFKSAVSKTVKFNADVEKPALRNIPEPQRPAPPAPIMLKELPINKEKSVSLPRNVTTATPSPKQDVSELSLRTSPGPSKMQTQHLQSMKIQDVQTFPAQSKIQAQHPLRELNQDSSGEREQNSRVSRSNHARSNSRQRTSDKAAKVLGEILPAPAHQLVMITGRSTDRLKSPTDIPPAVPTKDSKFVLPLSRYAVKGTAAEVKQKSGLDASPKVSPWLPPPSKPLRSATEPLTTEHMNTSYPRSKPSRLRSASDESLQRDVTNPRAKGTATSNFERMGLERPNVMTVMAVVKPAPTASSGGEVGVARTISLSRKPSQRILVKRNGNEVGEAKKQPQHHIPAVSLRPPRASSRPKGNLKRSESFKRAIEVGMDDEEEGDMRSGEFRARALSPEIGTVTTGLVFNGHKVMRSEAGIIEEM